MQKNKKNEELQSRREFFKKAAKGTLPILGAILLANMPMVMKAANPSGCTAGRCSGTCSGGCTSCTVTCGGNCHGKCSGTCRVTCGGNCHGKSS